MGAPEFRLNPRVGTLEGALYLPSPNCDKRPAGVEIDLLVIHHISLPAGSFGGEMIIDLFLNRLDPTEYPPVSAHCLIRRGGELLQFVPFNDRAWHAGVSFHQGREACNDFSIGIELEGTGEVPYEPIQYQQLIQLTRMLFAAYPKLCLDRVVGHSDIAPGRKTDPGPSFDWDFFRQSLRECGA